ncbi:MAG: M23 family metallopeptidase, partial [Mobilitalea sp.]
ELKLTDETTFFRGIGPIGKTTAFQELYNYYNAVLIDLEYFPVPKIQAETADINYDDTWNQLRSYGGNRRHEGTDLMASNNKRGFFPIISITDGIVEKKGWLEQGGYRIGIRSEAGGYFYYAHLNSYAPELEQGDSVIAGQLLGFMGDSGYGSEGTIGEFDVHLHMGIYVKTNIGEMSVNPYWILRILEKNRTIYD